VSSGTPTNYGEAIRQGFEYLLENYGNVFAIGQGLWSPWYVGNSMTDLDKRFGRKRIIDTPVSELACTGAAVGASLCGYRPIVVHPRMDFMVLAIDQIVNQAAKWSHMLGGQASPAITIRAIINRGREQGAQHSQALHSWFAHVPGLRVVMPATVADARDLLIDSVLCDHPVLYIDDRWLYGRQAVLPQVAERALPSHRPQIRRSGSDITLVGAGFSAYLCEQSASLLEKEAISAEVIDVRILNPLDSEVIIESVARTRRLCVVDGSWKAVGFAGEIVASVCEALDPATLLAPPVRITLPAASAPTSRALESAYYPSAEDVTRAVKEMLSASRGGTA
jgi:pyruvate dehydrogenase E1 component beta subunit